MLAWSFLLLIRGILAALRQKIHLTTCPNSPGHLSLQWFDEVEHLSSMLGFLREGQSVGVIPRMALLGQSLPRIRIRALTHPTIERTIGLVRCADASLSVSAQALWDLVRAALVDFAREK